MADPTPLKVAQRPVEEGVLRLAEDVLEQVKTGEIIALAVVAVHPAGNVGIRTAHNGKYHHLNSGAARLAAALAGEPPDA